MRKHVRRCTSRDDNSAHLYVQLIRRHPFIPYIRIRYPYTFNRICLIDPLYRPELTPYPYIRTYIRIRLYSHDYPGRKRVTLIGHYIRIRYTYTLPYTKHTIRIRPTLGKPREVARLYIRIRYMYKL